MFRKKNKEIDNSTYRDILNASTVGMAFVSGMIVGGVMGYFIDKWLGTSPWFLFIFIILGIIAGIKNALHFLKKAGITLEKITKTNDADNEEKK